MEKNTKSCCLTPDVGFKTPLEAYKDSKREELLYTVALPLDITKPDYLITVDTNPESSTYS